MPVLFIYGVPENKVGILEELTNDLINTVAYSVEELKLTTSDVSCFYPKDLMSKGLGEEIIIFVDCLTVKPERTEAVRNKLAKAIVDAVIHYFSDANLVECFIKPFNPEHGFSGIRVSQLPK